MVADPTSEPAPSFSKSKKSKKKKAKANASATNGETQQSHGHEQHPEQEDDAGEEDPQSAQLVDRSRRSSAAESTDIQEPQQRPPSEASHHAVNGVARDGGKHEAEQEPNHAHQGTETSRQGEDQLRTEVKELQASLESQQRRHEEELANINSQLEQTQTGKDHAETRYQKLLGQVNTIKTQLGERLKSDAEELSRARSHIEDLEEQNRVAKDENESLQSQISELNTSNEKQESELQDLRGRSNVSQQNWAKERDELLQREAQVREEYENARQAMQDWEVLAMEERSIREGLSDRVSELEEHLSNQRDAFDRAASERDSQSTTVDGLQRALQEIQDARKQELREIVERSQTELEELRAQLKTSEESASASQTALQTTRADLERALPFEKEVKEKNLLIGKLRHEAVILNDHLTKALRFLKKGKPEDNVDRQLVTNHFLHFLALDRSDPKRFQILQLISALLGWTEEQNETAGLARPGASSQPINPAQSSSLRVPFSSFRRVSSSTSLNSPRSPSMSLRDAFTSPTGGSFDPNAVESPLSGNRSESLAELWSGYLEREASERPSHSRRTSTSSNAPATLKVDKRKENSIREEGEG